MPITAAAPFAASSAALERWVAASANTACVSSAFREAIAVATIVPQVCCSFKSGCCFSDEKFSFKSRAYAGTVSISSSKFIILLQFAIVTIMAGDPSRRISGGLLNKLKCGFALLPVARAQFIGLKRIQHAQDFLRIASDRTGGDIRELNHAVGVHEKSSALGDTFNGIDDSKLLAQVAFDVGEHRERQVLQIWMVVTPCMMYPLGVSAPAQDLRIAFLKLFVEFAEAGNFRRADKSKILWPEEIELPLAFVIQVGNCFECGFRVPFDANSCCQ